jgi:ribosome-binding ATPase YchF (GTP1/OBG family)
LKTRNLDIEVINMELCLADLETVENRIGRIAKKAKAKDAEAKKLQGKDLADGADYIAIMEENLKAFKEALD